MAKVLVIEDEAEIRELIRLHLQRDGHEVVEAGCAEESESHWRSEDIDLAVIDWMLPGSSGLTVVKELGRTTRKVAPAALMVTAKGEPEDIITALESGADDYLVKPFDPGILMARVRALLRRQKNLASSKADALTAADGGDSIRAGHLIIDLAKHEVTVDGQNFSLTISEFRLLETLVRNQGRVLTRAMLVAEIQGEGISVVGRTIDTHVFGLRKKLGSHADVIETVRGVGYRVKAL